MDFIFILIAIIFSAVLPTALYFYFPFLMLCSIMTRESIVLNKISKLYMYVFMLVFVFFILHTFYTGAIQLVFLKGLLRYFAYFSFALYVSTLHKKKISLIFKSVILFFVFSFPLVIYQEIFLGRYQSIFEHANHFSYVLIVCVYYVVKYQVFKPSIRPVILLILILSLFFASSSGATITLLLLLLYHYYSKSKQNLIKFIFSFLILLGFTVAISFTDKISGQISSLQYINLDFLYDKAKLYDPGGYGSFVWRLIYWIQILQSFLANNDFILFFGEGIDTLTKDNYVYPFMYTDPHNDYLKVLVEFGFIGLALFFLFLYRIYTIFKRADILLVIVVPLCFANIIVNWPFNLFILLYLVFEFYSNYDLNRKYK